MKQSLTAVIDPAWPSYRRRFIAIETFWSFRELRPCPCLEDCCRLRRLERIGTAAGNQIVADDLSPQADFPYWRAVLCEHQQHKLSEVSRNGGAWPQGGQRFPFDVVHVFRLKVVA